MIATGEPQTAGCSFAQEYEQLDEPSRRLILELLLWLRDTRRGVPALPSAPLLALLHAHGRQP